jgi:ABC-2 type transport system permease protein
LLVPLLIVVLVAPSVAAEREAGTWALLLSLGVRPERLVFGKAIGLASALMLLLAPAALMDAVVLATQSGGEHQVGIRALFMASGYLAYYAAFLLVGLAISTLMRTSRMALLVLLAFWLLNALIPRVTSDLARRHYPLPSAAELASAIATDLRQGIDGHNPEGRRLQELTARVLAQYRAASVDALPVNFDGIVLQEGEEYGNRVFDAHYARLWSQFEKQNHLHVLGALLTPLPAIQAWSLALARTDWAHQRHFATEAERYRRRLVKAMNEEVIYRSTSRAYERNRRGHDLWSALPDFQYEPPPLREILRQQVPALMCLGGWCAAAATFCAWAARRYGARP